MFAVGGPVLAAAVEQLDAQPPTSWTRSRRLAFGAVLALGLGLVLRDLAELA